MTDQSLITEEQQSGMTEQEIINIMHEFASLKLSFMSLRNGETKLVMKQEQNSDLRSNDDSVAERFHPDTERKVSNFAQVKAPLVGTYYEASSPDAKPFVEVNQKVVKGDTIALIEAMKMMNEVKSPVSGTVKNILTQNGELVEFDSVLMEISED